MKKKNTHIIDFNGTQKVRDGFKLPDNYFDSFEEELFSKIVSEDLPTNTGYTTPIGYFDTIEDKIINQYKNETKPKVISIRKKVLQLLPLSAAAIIILFIGINFFNEKNDFTINDDDFETILQSSDINNYRTFISEIIDDDIFNIPELNDEITFSNNELLEYLENTDTNTLSSEIDF